MDRRVLIVGGGASGLTAAIFCARRGARVTLVEHMDRVGKKILSTGNGRCNLTNLRMGPECYRCGERDFPMMVLDGFPVDRTLQFFEGLGIEPKDRNGYIYPNSDQASSVLDVLRCEVERLGVKVLLSRQVQRIMAGGRGGKGFELHMGQEVLWGDALILAAGSKAAPSTGSDGSGYELAKGLGHHVIKPLPALVQLRCQGNLYRQMAGIRTDARVSLLVDGVKMAEDRGELQLVDYGLSGIPVFQISRYASRALDQGRRVVVYVDFLPSWGEEAFGRLMGRRERLGYKSSEDLLCGLLNKKLALVLLKLAGISPEQRAGEISDRQLKGLLDQLKSYKAVVMSVNPFANAQVCCGGVDTREVDPRTMESRLVAGLYFSGELLDVDGICGGYNLQFAWSSGALAGIHAAGGTLDDSEDGDDLDRLWVKAGRCAARTRVKAGKDGAGTQGKAGGDEAGTQGKAGGDGRGTRGKTGESCGKAHGGGRRARRGGQELDKRAERGKNGIGKRKLS